jgi:hypothetical protein
MAYLPEIVLEWILLIYLKIFFVINFYRYINNCNRMIYRSCIDQKVVCNKYNLPELPNIAVSSPLLNWQLISFRIIFFCFYDLTYYLYGCSNRSPDADEEERQIIPTLNLLNVGYEITEYIRPWWTGACFRQKQKKIILNEISCQFRSGGQIIETGIIFHQHLNLFPLLKIV